MDTSKGVKFAIGSTIVTIILATIIICTAVLNSGCSSNKKPECIGFRATQNIKKIANMTVYEIVDENTGVHYYFGKNDTRAFMSPVYNSDGTIKVDKED
jgi:hypothetical protein